MYQRSTSNKSQLKINLQKLTRNFSINNQDIKFGILFGLILSFPFSFMMIEDFDNMGKNQNSINEEPSSDKKRPASNNPESNKTPKQEPENELNHNKNFKLNDDIDILGLDVDILGYSYIVDAQHHRLLKLDLYGKTVLSFGGGGEDNGRGATNGKFNVPWDVAVDSSGNVYGADYNQRIQIFDSLAIFQDAITLPSKPTSVDVDFSDNVFVATYPYALVFDKQKNLLLSLDIGVKAIATDNNGNFYVVIDQPFDGTLGEIQKYNLEGDLLLQILPKPRGQIGYFSNNIKGIEISPSGEILIADQGQQKVLVLNSAGKYLEEYTSFGSSLERFNSVRDVVLDTAGNLWVAEGSPSVLTVFTPDYHESLVIKK